MEVSCQLQTPAVLFPEKKIFRYQLNRKLGWSHSRIGRPGKQENPFPMSEMEPPFLGRRACNLFIIPTDLSRFILRSELIGRMGEFEMWLVKERKTVGRE
jgi:hypothetical protein